MDSAFSRLRFNTSLTDFINATSLSGGSNIFLNLQQYDQLFDSKYVQIVNTLAQAYRDDQLPRILISKYVTFGTNYHYASIDCRG